MSNNHHKQNIGIWIFLSVLLVMGTVVALYFVNDNSIKQAQKQEQEQIKADKKAVEEKASNDKFVNNLNRSACTRAADNDYWSYVKINATSSKEDSGGQILYTAPKIVWDTADSNKQQAVSNCYREYPN
jgi:hypothetical protein